MTRRSALLTLASGFACGKRNQALIGVVPKATSHRFFVTIRGGVEAAGREFGVQIQWNGPGDETDHNRQIQIVDAMVARRVDAIAISATDENALAAPVERAIQAGIPVTVFDSGVNVSNIVSFIATGNEAAGVLAARKLAGLVTEGPVGMVMQKPGGTSTGLREGGFERTLEREHPAVRLVAKQYCMADPARSRAVAENILTAHPDLKGLFASSEAASIGAIQALRGRGMAGSVRVITFDSSDAHIAALREGVIDLMLVQDAYRIGYEAVHTLVQRLRGGGSPKRLDLPAREIVAEDLAKPDVRRLLSIA